MRDEVDAIRARGAELIIVGNGSAHFARAFREDLELDGPILVDPDLRTYQVAGLRRGGLELLSTRLASNALRAWRAGYRQQGVQGDALQLGGIFVLNAKGDLVFEHASREAGDHPDPAEILEALDRNEPIDDAPAPAEPAILTKLAGRAIGALFDPTIVLSFSRTGYAARSLAFSEADLDVDLQGRHFAITGANSGIGYETAWALAAMGGDVTLLCRSLERGERAAHRISRETGNDRVRLLTVDLSDLAAVRSAAAHLAEAPLDVLIHNAGALPDRRIESTSGLELTFATHVVGPHLLTRLLQHRISESPDGRILFVTSGGMYPSRLDVERMVHPPYPYDGVAAYSMTKRAQVVLAELWADELQGRTVVHSMHPGWADTPAVRDSLPRFHQMMRPLLRTPAEGADTLVWLAASVTARETTGQLFLDREPRRTHYLPFTGESEKERRALWQLCNELTRSEPIETDHRVALDA